jgi:putative toxin-antitoxin system antitoxin component (TIGR02293 family)
MEYFMAAVSTDWVKFLGLGRRKLSPLGYVDWVNEGLPAETLNRVTGAVAPDDKQFINRLVGSKSTRYRRSDKPLSVESGFRTVRLAIVWVMAVEVWKSEEAARAFLNRPHPMLEGRKPIDVAIQSELGAEMVKSILGELKYGTAA